MSAVEPEGELARLIDFTHHDDDLRPLLVRADSIVAVVDAYLDRGRVTRLLLTGGHHVDLDQDLFPVEEVGMVVEQYLAELAGEREPS